MRNADSEEPRKDAETQRNAMIFLMVEFGIWILKNHAETRRRRDFFGGGIWSAGFEEPRKDAETQRNAMIFSDGGIWDVDFEEPRKDAETQRNAMIFSDGGIWDVDFEEPRKDAETQRNAKIFLMVEFGMQVLKNHAKTQRREGTQRFFLDFNLRVKFHLLGP